MSLRWKIFSVYFVILIVSLASTGIYLFNNIYESYLNNERVTNLTQANMIANLVSNFIGVSSYLIEPTIVDYSKQINSRVLFTDVNGKVVVDSAGNGELEGKDINSYSDVRAALKGSGSTSIHYISGSGWTMYAAVPVTAKNDIVGSILLSTSIDDVMGFLNTIKMQMIYTFTAIGSIVSILSLIVADFITKPLKRLTDATKVISEGKFDYKVNIKGSDEIGKLAESFNEMGTKLMKIDDERKRFVSDASHELKTPLAAIKALVEPLISNENIDISLYKEFLRDINDEVDRMTRLVNELLVLARMDKINSIKNKTENISEIAYNVIENLEAIAKNKGVSLVFDSDEKIFADVDADRFYRMIYNVVENGIKYTPEGGSVTLKLSCDDKNVYIKIADTGIGISQETLPKVFERFSRGDTARSQKTGGFGLGLAIVKEIVDLHKGHIDVKSTVGKGTEFDITIPVKNI
ncbi:ATP-binding protein [Thermoanaerobacterium sp. RBIITD]|uniref:sensor histidine kinase n=1 Tax=Thermoanaerobacterium sp. RBIITD TaxID=1550240 RepID=UPI000BB7DB6C|nr:ATP-binding protein [Thermoanaerobacterium sp. RBIITD]SNX53151.1 Signal transduction histidine kinase [Thermoanaerobacterium sp. RBIITD]